jgi:hypothetical protein
MDRPTFVELEGEDDRLRGPGVQPLVAHGLRPTG